jgi:hypothetical protein
MTASSSISPRCTPDDLLPVLTAGRITGLYQGDEWIDWDLPSPLLEIVPASQVAWLAPIDRRRFHIVVDDAPYTSATLARLVARSRGVGVASSRLGRLLQSTQRIATAQAVIRDRYRSFAGYPEFPTWMEPTQVRSLSRSEVQRSRMLSLLLDDPVRAGGLLHTSFPGLQIEESALHLPLPSQSSEEVLVSLWKEGIAIRRSVVWFWLLQFPPQFSQYGTPTPAAGFLG